MDHVFEFDPHEVLGLERDAPLERIHEAYRERARKHHPDGGGDAWAFRLVSQAYEVLSRARVARRAAIEMDDLGPGPAWLRSMSSEPEPRLGVDESPPEPDRLVGVELLLLRFELQDPTELFMGTAENHNLSCNLEVTWPADAPFAGDERSGREIRKSLANAVRAATRSVRPTNSAHRDDPGRFQAWIGYGSAQQVEKAFEVLHAFLNDRDLAVRQTIRDLAIPRSWKARHKGS